MAKTIEEECVQGRKVVFAGIYIHIPKYAPPPRVKKYEVNNASCKKQEKEEIKEKKADEK